MHCPVCQHPENLVLRTETRETVIRRRRECCQCRHRWTTFETSSDVSEKLNQIKEIVPKLADLIS